MLSFGERDLPNHLKGSSEDVRDDIAPARNDAPRDYALKALALRTPVAGAKKS